MNCKMTSLRKPRHFPKVYNVIEVISGTTIYGGPFSLDQVYLVRDNLQVESLNAGHILTEYRYAIRLVD